nr:hypothetical protein [Tanacetum cinerariifolium]
TNKIDVTDEACEEYSQEVLNFSDVTASGSPTPSDDPIACEAKTIKSSVDEPPEVELRDLPPHLEYAFLEGDNKLPVIIAKELGDEEKAALIKVLQSHKRAIAWKLSDIQGINPEFCTYKILMEEDYKSAVSPVHYVPKKGGFTVVKNEENVLIPTRLVTKWRGTSTVVSSMVSPGIFKFPSTLVIRKKQPLPALMGRSPTVACLSICAMRQECFKGACWLSFMTWLKRRWKSLWTTSWSLGILSKPVSLG